MPSTFAPTWRRRVQNWKKLGGKWGERKTTFIVAAESTGCPLECSRVRPGSAFRGRPSEEGRRRSGLLAVALVPAAWLRKERVAQVDEAQTYLISGSGQHGRRGARCPIGDQPVRCAVRPVTGLPHATREALC